MSSHREAPEISKDPVADSTDTYAFVSPDKPDTVTIITNYIPLEDPAGGPNFFEFGDDVLYRINVDNDGDGRPDVLYEFRFKTTVTNPNTFLYNTGPITALDSPNFNRRQTYSVTEVRKNRLPRKLGDNLTSPPCNVGARSTPNYANLANAAIHVVSDDIVVFAGQRLDGFFVDLGAVFDLAALRPFQNLHLIPTPAAAGRQRAPVVQRAHDRDPDPDHAPHAGRLEAERPDGRQRHDRRVGIRAPAEGARCATAATTSSVGPFVQVSRLGNPLFNEVIVPMGRKDEWNADTPDGDKDYAPFVAQPELAKLLPVLYPGVFPNLAAFKGDRADLLAILLTGIPKGIIPGFQNFTGPTQADMLRLNVAIPPSGSPNANGILGGDLAGFPNGRRVFDDIVTIELRADRGSHDPPREPLVRARRRGQPRRPTAAPRRCRAT